MFLSYDGISPVLLKMQNDEAFLQNNSRDMLKFLKNWLGYSRPPISRVLVNPVNCIRFSINVLNYIYIYRGYFTI